jgi:hypothetical protein
VAALGLSRRRAARDPGAVGAAAAAPVAEERLVEALNAVSPELREQVLHCLAGEFRDPVPAPSLGSEAPGWQRIASLVRPPLGTVPSDPQQIVPVTFSSEQYTALRAWCQQHGVSTAVVVRELVAQFLEAQGAPAQPD